MALAANITKPGATNVLIEEELNPDFAIESIQSPTKGTATITGPTTLRWTIDELGVSTSEGATFDFFAKHVGITSGLKKVNESITYEDDEDNIMIFGDPEIDVECDLVIFPEPCPTPVDVDIQGCEDVVEVFAGDVNLSGLGRILHLDVRIKNVCPYKAVALAVILTEVDKNGDEHSRGMKTLVVPAHSYSVCRDVLVRCVEFVLPEELDVSGGDPKSICNERNFKARFIAHYIDNDYQCCEGTV